MQEYKVDAGIQMGCRIIEGMQEYKWDAGIQRDREDVGTLTVCRKADRMQEH